MMSEEKTLNEALADAWIEAVEEYLKRAREIRRAWDLLPEEEKAKLEGRSDAWDPSKIKWVPAEGAKGRYDRADPQASRDFQNMLKDLKEHGGRLTRDGYFYWVFRDQATVGRKKR